MCIICSIFQLAVFHEDFQREREDRAKAEGKMEKMRKERDTARMELTSKMKKMQAVVCDNLFSVFHSFIILLFLLFYLMFGALKLLQHKDLKLFNK